MIWRALQALQYFNNTNLTAIVSASYKSRSGQKHTLLNVGKQCPVCCKLCSPNYCYVKIYSQTEDTVLRICLLDRAYKVPQGIFVGASASTTLPSAEFICLRVAYREAFWEDLSTLI